jgi:hypothetical protein
VRVPPCESPPCGLPAVKASARERFVPGAGACVRAPERSYLVLRSTTYFGFAAATSPLPNRRRSRGR